MSVILGTCAECKFGYSAGIDLHECRKYPPVPVLNLSPMGLWPLVKSHDWCGKFQKAEEEL